MSHQDIAIITGASSGIGREISRLLKKEDELELWIVARRQERLDDLAEELREEGRTIIVLALDLLDCEAWSELEDKVKASGKNLRWLVNCAGFGFHGSFLQEEVSHLENMITLNVTALSSITRRLLPQMKRGSKIVNIASSMGFVPSPYYSIYAASKAFVLSFSVALSEELKDLGISVSAVCPGPVSTEFFDVASADAPPKFAVEEPKQTAFLAVEQSAQGKPIVMTGVMAWGFRVMSSLLPRVLVAKLIASYTKK